MIENPQKRHYETVHDDYEAHYFDKESMRYRFKYVYEDLFAGLDLNDKDLADLACGSGYNSIAIRELYPRVRVTGFDISSKACAAYEEKVKARAFEADLTKPLSHPQQYDVVYIFGGLHHCILDLPEALENVNRLLKPGGYFLFIEPNRESIFDGLRNVWYKLDPYFDASSEKALSHQELYEMQKDNFEVEQVRYLGGPAYFLIYNSMILRVPQSLKSIISRPLFWSESAYNMMPGKYMYPFFMARWKKKS